jgi:transcriptional regulator with XRE-family HTH domain
MELQYDFLPSLYAGDEAIVPLVGNRAAALQSLGSARRRQGVSVRSIAQRLGLTVAEVRQQEDECADLLLSELYRWQAALDVPLQELLNEPSDELSPRIKMRAQLLKIMKTVNSLSREAKSDEIRRSVQFLTEQLLEIMPELKEVAPWPAVGHRRSADEVGRIGENLIPDNWVNEAS